MINPPAFSQVQEILDEGIDQKIREGKLKFDAIKDDVREEVNKQKGKVETIIKDGTPELQKHVQRLTDSVSRGCEGGCCAVTVRCTVPSSFCTLVDAGIAGTSDA